MFEYIFSLIAPHLCIGCRLEGRLLCGSCTRALPPPPSRCYICQRTAKGHICRQCKSQTSLDKLVVRAAYEDVPKQLIYRLKFERASAAGNVIARLMAQQLAKPPKDAVVTYAPTAAKRVRVRGYDQSRLIAKQLAKELGLPFRPLLVRTGSTRQLGADKHQRKQQAQHAFVARRRVSPPRYVILVDDVITTGATMEAAATALKYAGVRRITGIVFAAA